MRTGTHRWTAKLLQGVYRSCLDRTLQYEPSLLPLALAIGAGSGIQQPLAIAIIAGLLLQYPLVLIAMPILVRLTLPKEQSGQRLSAETQVI